MIWGERNDKDKSRYLGDKDKSRYLGVGFAEIKDMLLVSHVRLQVFYQAFSLV